MTKIYMTSLMLRYNLIKGNLYRYGNHMPKFPGKWWSPVLQIFFLVAPDLATFLKQGSLHFLCRYKNFR